MGHTVGAIGTMQNESSPPVGACSSVTSAQATPRPTSVSAAPTILTGPNPSPSNTHDVPAPMIGTRYMNRDARATPRRAITQFHSVHATYTGNTTVQANAAHPAGVMRLHA